jgi:hypothetical protein
MPLTPTHLPSAQKERLLAFNQQLIDQALELVAAHAAERPQRYEGPVGAHLRHVIEHYDALLFPAAHGSVDYDNRARDRELEGNPARARERLLALRARLGASTPAALGAPVQVQGQGGTAGGFAFSVTSSIGRELAFVASHTVHHFALLVPHCRAHGIPTPADFGQAPSTVAHARAASATPTSYPIQEPTCLTSPLAA